MNMMTKFPCSYPIWENDPTPHHWIGPALSRAGFALHQSRVPDLQLIYHPRTHPVLWVGPPQPLPHLLSARIWEGTDPMESQPQDLHNLGQQQDIKEEFWCLSSIDGLPKPGVLNQSNSLQWTFADKTVWTKGNTEWHTAAPNATKMTDQVMEWQER